MRQLAEYIIIVECWSTIPGELDAGPLGTSGEACSGHAWMPLKRLIGSPFARTMSSAVTARCITAILPGEAAPAILGESPYYDYRSGLLFYIDILGKRIIGYNPKERSSSSMQLTHQIGFCVPSLESTYSDITLICGLETSIAEVNFSDKKVVRTISKVPEELVREGTRFNDAKCSPTGMLYGGYMHPKWREGSAYRGALLQLLPRYSQGDSKALNTLKTELSPDEVWLPNGSVWCVEGSIETCYLVDSGSHTVKKYQVGPKFTFVETVYELPSDLISDGYVMDGMTIDSANRLYIVCPNGSNNADKLGLIIVLDTSKAGSNGSGRAEEAKPDGSAVVSIEVGRISMPNKKPVACCFGGHDLDTLFVTSRNDGSGTTPEGLLYELQLEGGIKGSSKYTNIPCKVTSSHPIQESACNAFSFLPFSLEDLRRRFWG